MKTKVVLIFCMVLLAGFVSANQVELQQFPVLPGYESSSVVLDYVYSEGFYSNVALQGENLRPNSDYMLVLLGRPSCLSNPFDDFANELVGLAGSWSCVNCDCSLASCDRTDEQYYTNKLKSDSDLSKECIQGFLVLDYFVSDSSGSVFKAFDSDGNIHFLWCHNDFCRVDFLGSDSYDVVFRIKDESGGFTPLFNTGFTFFHSRGGSGGSDGGSSSGSPSGYQGESIPEFSAITAGLTLVGAGAGFVLLRKRK